MDDRGWICVRLILVGFAVVIAFVAGLLFGCC